MNRIIATCILITFVFSQQGEVANVVASQRTDGSHLIDVSYDLLPDDTFITFSVHGEISFDGGETWHIMTSQIIPNILGDNIFPGTGKQFVYDLGEQSNFFNANGQYLFTGFSDQTQIKIIAHGHVATELPFSMIQIDAGEFTWGEHDSTRSINYDYEIMEFEVTVPQYVEFLTEALDAEYVEIRFNDQNSGVDKVYGYYLGDDGYSPGFQRLMSLSDGNDDSRITWSGAAFIPHTGTIDMPMMGISYFGAYLFAEFYGLRLPTSKEWEKAARGMTGNDYPWGDDFDYFSANVDGNYTSQDQWDPYEVNGYYDPVSSTTPVGFFNDSTYIYPDGFPNGSEQYEYSSNDGRSIYGVHDMCGNAPEWVLYRPDLYDNVGYRETRGGSYRNSPSSVDGSNHKTWELSITPATYANGFRCAHTVSPQSD